MPSTTDTIREVLNDVARLTADATTFGENDDLYQRGLTSHATVNVLMGIEDAFDIELPDTLLRRDTFSSIAALRDAVLSCGVEETA
ncbi:acyl carrier protein [Humibacter albus]|jgi:acyl carrier protein|uniref:acyl carrier protein n=1 Tax=Humibacter albus TaxID=427754 RepID=UPI0003B30EF8|nr:acyl carrier protein [Humibacter albus]